MEYHLRNDMTTSNDRERQRAVRMAEFEAEQAEMERQKRLDIEDGIPALKRLVVMAQGSSGQCERVAAFLAGCYNGMRCPVDLSDLRTVDFALSEDILRVLRMDRWCQQEVHLYVENGAQVFERIIEQWGLDKRFKWVGGG